MKAKLWANAAELQEMEIISFAEELQEEARIGKKQRIDDQLSDSTQLSLYKLGFREDYNVMPLWDIWEDFLRESQGDNDHLKYSPATFGVITCDRGISRSVDMPDSEAYSTLDNFNSVSIEEVADDFKEYLQQVLSAKTPVMMEQRARAHPSYNVEQMAKVFQDMPITFVVSLNEEKLSNDETRNKLTIY
ncbi:hypothetical protein BJV82DRAFT_12883 [Fennellomyces sp. T-0311]|nr:hypothetical protein BJV82DRAFT_12883 [Fennellomyces sp. T-0311]